MAYSLYVDVGESGAGAHATTYLPFILLFVALLIALGFEFVNGFHDTANAVATVIYTHSLPAEVAVVWSGFFNFLGVLLSSGAVAFGIISLLPVELILQVGSRRGLRHGVRAADRRDHLEPRHLVSRSAGLELAHADRLDHRRRRRQCADARAWTAPPASTGPRRPRSAGRCCSRRSFGFCAAALLLLSLKFVVRNRRSISEPKGNQPPPWWIRGILILTCTGVSLRPRLQRRPEGHGPDHADPDRHRADRLCAQPLDAGQRDGDVPRRLGGRGEVVQQKAAGYNMLGNPRPAVTDYVSQRKINEGTYPSLAVLVQEISAQVEQYGSLAKVPAEAVGNTRNDMYLASEAIRFLMKDKENDLSKDEVAKLNAYKKSLDNATKFIPLWVKVAVAIALGLGTMVGWKRIVITVGEKIGKSHLTYAPGRFGGGRCRRHDRRRRRVRACRCRPRTCCHPASPAPWRPTARACRWRRCATC